MNYFTEFELYIVIVLILYVICAKISFKMWENKRRDTQTNNLQLNDMGLYLHSPSIISQTRNYQMLIVDYFPSICDINLIRWKSLKLLAATKGL